MLLAMTSVGMLASVARAANTPNFPASPAANAGNVTAANNQAATDQEAFAAAQFERQLDQYQYANRVLVNNDIPPEQRLLVDYGAYLTFNYLSVDDANANDHTLRETDAVGYARLNLDNAQEFFIRGEEQYQDFSVGDSFFSRQTRQHSAIQELYYRFDLQRYLSSYKGEVTDSDFSVTAGRQSIIWGNGLAFNQDLDALTLDGLSGPLTVEAVMGRTVRDTVDFDTSRPGFNSLTERLFFGGLATLTVGRNKPYFYVVAQEDDNPDFVSTEALAQGGAIKTHFDYNSVYVGGGSSGSLGDKLVYGIEGCFEGGSTLSNSFELTSSGIEPITQTHDPIRAGAADARIDYVFGDPHETRASAEMILASGSHDRGQTNTTFNGEAPHTTDQAFNGFGLLNTGLAFSPEVSNLIITRVGVSTKPLFESYAFRQLEVGADFFFFQKYLEHAPIDEESDAGRYLGCEPDIFLNYQITSDLTLATRYGVFFPGKKITSSDQDRQLFFTGVTLAF